MGNCPLGQRGDIKRRKRRAGVSGHENCHIISLGPGLRPGTHAGPQEACVR